MARTRRTLVACGVALLVLAGCSGGDDDDASSTAAPNATASGGPTTTMRPVDTSFTGQNSAQFCGLARTYSERFANVSPTATPAQLRASAREGQQAISQAVNAAPAEIKRDVEVLSNGFGALLTELEKVNFEATRLPPAALTGLQSPDFQASTVRFQAYVRNVCGIN